MAALRSRWIVSCLLALLGAASLPAPAMAGPRDEDLFIRPEDQHIVVFASADAGRSSFLNAGSKQALTASLDRPGFLLMEMSGFGLTRERVRVDDVRVPIQRLRLQSSVLVGFQAMDGPLYVAGYVGPESDQEQVAFDGRFARLSQPRLGVRAQGELWAHPTPDTLVTGTVIASSAAASLYARGSAGIRVFDRAFIGPEVTVYTTPTYRETRWGAHLTGPRLGIVDFRLSGGVMLDDGRRPLSPYLGVSAWIRL